MGFNKKYINKEGILANINKLDVYLKSDAMVMDAWSGKFYKDLDKNERKLRDQIKVDNMCLSGCPNSHKDYTQLKSLSETLLSLMGDNPDWLDIHFALDKLKPKIEEDQMGVFDELKEVAIKAIIEYYTI